MNLTVTEPVVEILPDDVFADVLLFLVNDEHLIDIVCKDISIEEALLKKFLRMFGDKEIGRYLLKALQNCIEFEKFESKPKVEADEDEKLFNVEGEDEYIGDEYYASSIVDESTKNSANKRDGFSF